MICNMEGLWPELGSRLDGEPVGAILEYVADRFDVVAGHWTLCVELRDGRLRQAYRRQGPLGAEAAPARRPLARVSPAAGGLLARADGREQQ